MHEVMSGRAHGHGRRGGAGSLAAPHAAAPALDDLRMQLLEQRRLRLDQLAALADPDAPGPLGSADRGIARTLAAGALAALADVDAALERLAAGTYGRCVACGSPIPLARLEVLPQAARCMPCERVVAVPPGTVTD